MSANERFRKRPVEPLNLSVHLGRARIGVEMDDALVIAKRLKMIGKLRAVVCLDMGKRYGRHLFEYAHEISGVNGGMRAICVGKGKLSF